MKRESGENPEQSRCCKLHQTFGQNFRHCHATGRPPQTEVSQKTCHGNVSSKAFEDKAEKHPQTDLLLLPLLQSFIPKAVIVTSP